MTTFFRAVIIFVTGAMSVNSAHADATNADPSLTVFAPFDTIAAIENLKLCAPDMKEDAKNLSDISYVYYEFDPPKGTYTPGNTSPLKIVRHTLIKMSKFSMPSLIEKISTIKKSSCEMHVESSNVSARIDDLHNLTVQFHVKAKARDCGHFLGIEYKIDKGSGNADVLARFSLNQNMQFSANGPPVLMNEHYETNDFYNFVGVIFGLGLPASLAIGELLKDIALDDLSDEVNKALGDSGNQDVFRAFNAAGASVEKYTNSLDIFPDLKLTLDFTRTGLLPGKMDPPEIEVVQSNMEIPWFYGEQAYDHRTGEITFIKELKNPRPRMHTVSAGESLWTIAQRYGLDPYSYIYIEDLNGLQGKKLQPGQQVEIPLQAEFCQAVVVNDALVRPGDSILGINRRKLFKPDYSKLRSGNPDLIYPYEAIQD